MAEETSDTPVRRRRRRRAASTDETANPPQEASEVEETGETRVAPAPPPARPFSVTKPDQGRGKFPRPPALKHGFDVITRRLFDDGYDPVKEWEEISAALEIHGALTPATLQKAANSMEVIADRAFRLAIVAKRELAAYMRETDPIVGAIREAATAILETEKRTLVEGGNGKKVPLRTKQITDADVTGACAQHYGDEWAVVMGNREKMELATKQIENLADLAKSRAATARAMLQPGRRNVG